MTRTILAMISTILAGMLLTTIAEAAIRKRLTPRISVLEQYDDNIYLDPENEDSDWITLVSPGISLALEGADSTMNLDYEAGFSFYREDKDMNSTRHRAQADWNQRLTRYLRLQASDAFSRSEDPIVEADGRIEEIRRERSIYYQNSGEASLSYEFGAEDQITAGYRNRYLDDRSFRNQDSQGHEGFLGLDKWFGQQYGIGMTLSYNRGEFEQSEDFEQYRGGLTVSYRWHPSRRLYGRYDHLYHDFEPAGANDYRVHQGALGASVALSPQTDFNVEWGYFVQHYLNGAEMKGETFNGSLNTRLQRASLGLAGSGGYDQDYFSSENLGSTEYRQVSGTADYLITDNLRAFASASFRREQFFGVDTRRDRKDRVWRATGGLSSSFSRWFTVSLEGSHSERNSDDPSLDFQDNRVMLRLTAVYPYVF